MALPPVEIIADDRERHSGVIEALDSADKVVLKIERLDVGDYIVEDRLLFERKTIRDFASSVIDGRFFSQNRRILSTGFRGVIILEGKGADLNNSNIRRETLQGALVNANVLMGLALLRSFNPPETARLMIYAGRQVKTALNGGVYRHGYRPKGKRQRQLYILQGLPCIGPGRAENLLEHFGGVQRVISAEVKELTQIPGIGPKIAEKISEAVKETPSKYTKYE